MSAANHWYGNDNEDLLDGWLAWIGANRTSVRCLRPTGSSAFACSFAAPYLTTSAEWTNASGSAVSRTMISAGELKAGWKAVIARGEFVHHYCSRTFAGSGVDQAALLEQNRKLFLEKWSQRPPPQSQERDPALPSANAAAEDSGRIPAKFRAQRSSGAGSCSRPHVSAFRFA